MTGEIIGPRGELIVVVMRNSHVVKVFSKYVYIYSGLMLLSTLIRKASC